MIKARSKLRVGQEIVIHRDMFPDTISPDHAEDFPAVVVEVLPHMIKWERVYGEHVPPLKQRGGFSRLHDQEFAYIAKAPA